MMRHTFSQPATARQTGIALGLSGGGYRASLFHLGAFWRFNELGLLPELARIDGVSGGAIVAAWLGLNWSKLRFDSTGRANNFADVIAQPLRRLCSRVLDIPVGLASLAYPVSALPAGLAHHLFGRARLHDLPAPGAGPEICMLSTNLLTGGSTVINTQGITEEYLGAYRWPDLPLATAVAASCSIPPSFRPVSLRTQPQQWTGGCEAQYAQTRRKPVALRLADGGNYDNLGLCHILPRYNCVLASIGSTPMLPWRWISGDYLTATLRSNRILIDVQRRMWLRDLDQLQSSGNSCSAAYWAIDDDPHTFTAPGALPCHHRATLALACLRTRLGRHTVEEQCRLINWGYAASDNALRTKLPKLVSAPAHWPCPDFPLQQ